MNISELKQKFSEVFGSENTPRVFASPGRVNLIGEHTDYNGGHVFPCALSFNTYVLIAKRNDRKIRLFSANFTDKPVIEADLCHIVYDKKQDWANYPLGVLAVLLKREYPIDSGFDILFWGDIPQGAGLSSSASIEVATAYALSSVFDLRIPKFELSKIGQEAENKFVGMNCGIMDQFAIGMGKEGHAILLDCNTLDYEYAPLDLKGLSIVIMNTNKRRELADSKYNERRGECERALQALQTRLNIKSLGELSSAEFEANKHLIENAVEQKRAKHAVYENERTLQAVQKLKEGDVETFGKLMNASHKSLQEDYEVTGKELDALVEAAWEQQGVLGARMTGAGFGGCAIALVKDPHVKNFIDRVGQTYLDKTGLKADFYIASIGGPARKMEKMY